MNNKLNKTMTSYLAFILLGLAICYPVPDGLPHRFDFDGPNFILDGQPFRFVACELHYPRIPTGYWEHRILMSKALGCNVISAYVFWNWHEQQQGHYDFESDGKDLGGFIALAGKHQMWVLIRPGPYVCAEWEAGGHPWWLIKEGVQLRSEDEGYVTHVRMYINALVPILEPLQVQNGVFKGNILMLQIENEYGYLHSDNRWPSKLKQLWDATPLQLKYYQAEPITGVKATHIPGVAIGINPGVNFIYFNMAKATDPNVPIFSSETWLGWYTHWGDDHWGHSDIKKSVNQVKFLVGHGYSFSIYMAHGGTSFGFWAGANMGTHYQPDITSYDYDSAITEAGEPTDRFHKIRELVSTYALWDIPDIPQHVGFIEIPEFVPIRYTNLAYAVQGTIQSVNPLPMEHADQQFGMISYSTTVGPITPGQTLYLNVHDYAHVYINDKLIGVVERRLGDSSIKITNESQENRITVLVEALGRINFGSQINDQKGLIGKVYLGKQELTNWTHELIPLDQVEHLQASNQIGPFAGAFFKATIDIRTLGDTYLDLSKWSKGYVWINGRNLGRFWEIGPQKRLYVPSTFMKQGSNEIIILDLNRHDASPIMGTKTMK